MSYISLYLPLTPSISIYLLLTSSKRGLQHINNMIKDIVLVGIGSGIGGICRYLVSLAMSHVCNGFPWATFSVNVAGCLLIGILWGLTSRFQSISPTFTLFLMVGFCGGFTTFSTFSKEGLALLQANNYMLFVLYTIGSVVLGIAAVALGFLTTK